MWCPIGIAFKSDGRHGDDRTRGEALFEIVIFGLAFRQAEPPAVIMDDDGDVIRVVKRPCAAIKRRIIEVPLRRSDLPDKLGKIVPVLVVPVPATFRGEIKLLPPLELGLRRQRCPVGCLTGDKITAYRNERLAALRPEHRHDVSRPPSPIEAGENCLVDLERIHQRDDVESNRRLLSIPKRFAGKKARRTEAPQIGDDYPIARRCQQGRNLDVAVDVVRPALQKNHRRAIGRASFSVAKY